MSIINTFMGNLDRNVKMQGVKRWCRENVDKTP